ncbi:MAG: polar amino acid transport system permease protein [Methylophilaceae bacterium]|jgi:polar amino acid transport system permease protein|tara:strand:+ start:1051 stop:1728 length:678 start_codon:yes stop_codon:yes gene_type:complete
MGYTLIYSQVTEYIPYLLAGAWISLQIVILAFSGGMFFGLILASIKTFGNVTLRRIVIFYVTFFTNTPQLVQIYFLFFALPEIGILLSPFVAVLIGMTLNAAAYMCEIQRAGFLSVRQNELDAARTMSFSIVQQVRFVILPHIMKVLFPPLSNHYILMTLGTSMAAIFGVEELTGRAFNINSETFRSVEIFSITALIYIIITFIATLLLAIIGKYLFKAKIRIIQ